MKKPTKPAPGECQSHFYGTGNPSYICTPQTECDYEKGTWVERCRYCGQLFRQGRL